MTENMNKPEIKEKLYTKEEVSKIVQARLKKEKEKYNNDITLEERERAVRLKELKFIGLEKLKENRLPERMIDLVQGNTEEEINKSISTIKEIWNDNKKTEPVKRVVDVNKLPEGDVLHDSLESKLKNIFNE